MTTEEDTHKAVKELLYLLAFGGKIKPPGKDWPDHVKALAAMFTELRERIAESGRKQIVAEAELKVRTTEMHETPCTMAARIDAGHGKDGYCAIMARACPRACLLKQIERWKMQVKSEQRSAQILHEQVQGRRSSMRPLDVEMHAQGFARIGRMDHVGRRSLWMKIEPATAMVPECIVLRAGREGDDEHVIIAADHPWYEQIKSVLQAARFAAEWENPNGTALMTEDEINPPPATDEGSDAEEEKA